MRYRALVLFFGLLFASTAFSQSASSQGEAWLSMSQGERTWYVIGFVSGHARGGALERYEQRRAACPPPKAEEGLEAMGRHLDCMGGPEASSSHMRSEDVTLLVEGVSQFYSDVANRRIPVAQVLEVIQRRISGSISDANFQSWLEVARQVNAAPAG